MQNSHNITLSAQQESHNAALKKEEENLAALKKQEENLAATINELEKYQAKYLIEINDTVNCVVQQILNKI